MFLLPPPPPSSLSPWENTELLLQSILGSAAPLPTFSGLTFVGRIHPTALFPSAIWELGRPKIITFPTFSSLTVVCWRGFIPLRLLSNKVDIADYKDDHGGDCKDFISKFEYFEYVLKVQFLVPL